MFHRTADRLVEALLLDIWPEGGAVYMDFGLNEENYAAYQKAVKARRNEVTADKLHAACGSSSKLSALIGHPVHLMLDWDHIAS